MQIYEVKNHCQTHGISSSVITAASNSRLFMEKINFMQNTRSMIYWDETRTWHHILLEGFLAHR